MIIIYIPDSPPLQLERQRQAKMQAAIMNEEEAREAARTRLERVEQRAVCRRLTEGIADLTLYVGSKPIQRLTAVLNLLFM